MAHVKDVWQAETLCRLNLWKRSAQLLMNQPAIQLICTEPSWENATILGRYYEYTRNLCHIGLSCAIRPLGLNWPAVTIGRKCP